MAAHDTSRFTYRVRWSPAEGVYIAAVVEFPGLTATGDWPLAAINAAKGLTAGELNRSFVDGTAVPDPVVRSGSCRR